MSINMGPCFHFLPPILMPKPRLWRLCRPIAKGVATPPTITDHAWYSRSSIENEDEVIFGYLGITAASNPKVGHVEVGDS